MHWRNPPGRCTSRVNLRHSQSGRCTRGVSLWRMQSGQCTLRASPAIQIPFRRTVAGVYPARLCESEFTVCVIVLPHSSSGVNSFLMEAGCIYSRFSRAHSCGDVAGLFFWPWLFVCLLRRDRTHPLVPQCPVRALGEQTALTPSEG